jgi:glycosyltransferase involved in cell wall biosynthesis
MDSKSALTSRPPRLSIGVPVYNEERYIDGCIRSIVEQTYTDFELIICDNASTDRTHAIALEWAARDPRISVHRAERNRGAAPNFNWCFELARGELFKWAAADDLLKLDYVAKCVAALDANPDASLAYSGAYDIDADGAIIGEIHDNQWPLRFSSANVRERVLDLMASNHACISVFGVMRTAALRKSTLIGAYAASDHVLLVEMALHGRFIRVGDDLLLHREHPGRFTRKLKSQQSRGNWFDTSRRGASFPNWRLLREYSRAVLVSDQSFSDKLGCGIEVLRWLKWGAGKMLVADLAYHFKRPEAA